MKNQILIIGSGQFGKAIYKSLFQNKNNKIYFYKKEKIIKKIPDFIFFCIPSNAIEDIINILIENFGQNAKLNIISCSKGIKNDINPFFSEYIKKRLPFSNFALISGPGFALNIAKKAETLLNLAIEDDNYAKKIISLFENSSIALKKSQLIKLIEIASVFKNIIAIKIGYLEAQKASINTITKEILEFLEEFKLIIDFFQYNRENILEPAILGDIILTCFSQQSRNKKFGYLLYKNLKKAKLFSQKNIIEGFYNFNAFYLFLQKNDIKMQKIEKIKNLLSLIENE